MRAQRSNPFNGLPRRPKGLLAMTNNDRMSHGFKWSHGFETPTAFHIYKILKWNYVVIPNPCDNILIKREFIELCDYFF